EYKPREKRNSEPALCDRWRRGFASRSSLLVRFARLLCVSGIVRSELEENILKTEAHAFQLKKCPAFLDDSGGNRAANIFALGSLDRCQYVALRRRRFNLDMARARNLRQQF